MKTQIIELIENRIDDLTSLKDSLNHAAATSPFGNAIDLSEKSEELLNSCEQRVRTAIWMTHRIKALQMILEEIKEVKE